MPLPQWAIQLWENVTANVIASAVVNSTVLSMLLLLGLAIWACIRWRQSRLLRRESEALLGHANYAVHNILNTKDEQFVRKFEIWDSNMRDKLEALRRKGVCDAWQVDHFKVLGSTQLVIAVNDDPKTNGEIVEKAKRLKSVAKELNTKAERLWPFS